MIGRPSNIGNIHSNTGGEH